MSNAAELKRVKVYHVQENCSKAHSKERPFCEISNMFKENHYQKKEGKIDLFQKAAELSVALQTAKNVENSKIQLEKM